ncbi:hypothetical protein [Paenibacillus sp. sgz500958]|uniref:hypothetical protein n=1 Tax=Paenibacillus sp. sgz500958 TaxID=3242475 RepID=UPI0036D3BF8C
MKYKINILLQIECTLFFQQNPYAFHTIEGLAIHIGRSKELLEEVLMVLCEKEIVEAVRERDGILYRYRSPEQTTIIKE